MTRQTSRPNTNPVLVAEMEDIRPFARLLRGVALKSTAVVEIIGEMNQISVMVEDSRTLCAIAWIPTAIFSSFTFHLPPNPPIFEIELDSLLHCLSVLGNTGFSAKDKAAASKKRFGTASAAAGTATAGGFGGDGYQEDEGRWGKDKKSVTGMRMEWMGEGHELRMLLRSQGKGPTTEFSLRTLEPDQLMNPAFDIDQLVLNVQMRSEWLLSALLDLPPSSTRITLIATPPSPRPLDFESNANPDESRTTNRNGGANTQRGRRGDMGQFTIQAEGDFGSVELDYPNHHDVLEQFACDEEGVSFSYHSAHFTHLARALQGTVKVCIRIEECGLLCAQIMTQEPVELDKHLGLLEYKMQPLEEDTIG